MSCLSSSQEWIVQNQMQRHQAHQSPYKSNFKVVAVTWYCCNPFSGHNDTMLTTYHVCQRVDRRSKRIGRKAIKNLPLNTCQSPLNQRCLDCFNLSALMNLTFQPQTQLSNTNCTLPIALHTTGNTDCKCLIWSKGSHKYSSTPPARKAEWKNKHILNVHNSNHFIFMFLIYKKEWKIIYYMLYKDQLELGFIITYKKKFNM